jgi:aminomuconate-semialdehyde/2-hydroxymuconate-6-semialdehyde dehydrogenase
MLETTVRSSFNNQGQICLCGLKDLRIERSIYPKFKKDFVERVQPLKVGDPTDPANNLGAVVSKLHFEKVLGCIALAREEGGTVLAGGHALQMPGHLSGGWYITPTVIEGLTAHCRTNQEEIFGPVVTIQPFDTEDDVLAAANSTDLRPQQPRIWTSTLNRAHRAGRPTASGYRVGELLDAARPAHALRRGEKLGYRAAKAAGRRCGFSQKPRM